MEAREAITARATTVIFWTFRSKGSTLSIKPERPDTEFVEAMIAPVLVN
jgi:hypothetical protein